VSRVDHAKAQILDSLRRGRATRAAQTARRAADREIYADLPSATELVTTFTRQLQALRGEVVQVRDESEAARALEQLLADYSAEQVVVQDGGLAGRVVYGNTALGRFAKRTEAQSPSELARCEVGVTDVDALIARTGSLGMHSSRGGRLLSVLPPVHVAVAAAEQLVDSLDVWLKSGATSVDGQQGPGSTQWIITGPSRTADIEKILVLGAHGPRRLVVVLIAP